MDLTATVLDAITAAHVPLTYDDLDTILELRLGELDDNDVCTVVDTLLEADAIALRWSGPDELPAFVPFGEVTR